MGSGKLVADLKIAKFLDSVTLPRSPSLLFHMALQTDYGVLAGTVQSADLQNPSGGQWPHYHIYVQTPAGLYDSAVNLKSLTEVKIEYRTRDLDPTSFANDLSVPNGWTKLAQTSTSGALDYIRRPGLTGTQGWILQNGDNLINQLVYLLTGVQRIFIFGAAYNTGLGVHDVHMNQGDPPGSPFAALDAIWQDGGLIFQYGPPQPRTTVLQIKFETQSLFTDDQGHPLLLKIPRYYYEYIPRWKWPPGDPLSDLDRRVLVEGNLLELLQWAGAIDYVTAEAKGVLRKELHRELERTLTKASPEYLDRAADYVVKMSVHLGNLRNEALR